MKPYCEREAELWINPIINEIMRNSDGKKSSSKVLEEVLDKYDDRLKEYLKSVLRFMIDNKKYETKLHMIKLDLIHIAKNYPIDIVKEVTLVGFGFETHGYCAIWRLYKELKEEYFKMKDYYKSHKDTVSKEFKKKFKSMKNIILEVKALRDDGISFECTDKSSYDELVGRGDIEMVFEVDIASLLEDLPYDRCPELYDNYIFKCNQLNKEEILEEYRLYRDKMKNLDYATKNIVKRVMK